MDSHNSTNSDSSKVVVTGGTGGVVPLCYTTSGTPEPTLATMTIALIRRGIARVARARRHH
jgi:hypothetical protein